METYIFKANKWGSLFDYGMGYDKRKEIYSAQQDLAYRRAESSYKPIPSS
jgi:hypothetical protein